MIAAHVSMLGLMTKGSAAAADKITLDEDSGKSRLAKQLDLLEGKLRDTELKCQRHLDERRELKSTVRTLQSQLSEAKAKFENATRELQAAKTVMAEKEAEWAAFQKDLLTTVRVANDFKVSLRAAPVR